MNEVFHSRTDDDGEFHNKIVKLIPPLRSYARSLTRNPVDADDLVQETLLRAIQHVNTFEIGTNLRAWLFTIMRNRFYTNIKKLMRETTGVDNCASEMIVIPPPQDLKMKLRDVERALLDLPLPYRTTIAFVALRGKSYRSAAKHFDCDIGTIKSRINRARRMMRHSLE